MSRSSAAAQTVAEKHQDVVTKYNNAIDKIEELHDVAVSDMLPSVLQEMKLEDDPQAEARSRAFLDDRATLFRFYRRGRYSEEGAIALLTTTLTWRLRTDLDSLSLSSLHPLYVSPPARPPLFWCNTKCVDKLGRPAGVISLGSLERSVKEDGSNALDECREYIVGCMESVRRHISNLYAKATEESRVINLESTSDEALKPLQMVIIFSLQSSGMANLELELLPFLLDLLKNHFPGMIGAVYIVHYGWVHAGMWGLAKRLLPQQALARIFFPSKKELPEHFDLEKLPTALGGTWDVILSDETNDVMKRFARPHLQGVLYSSKGGRGLAEEPDWESNSAPPSPRGISGTSSPAIGRSSRAVSRSSSFDSLAEHFYSTSNTPRFLTPRASQTPTPHNELSHFSFTSEDSISPVSSMLRMTPTAAMKLQQVQKSRERAARKRSNSDAHKRASIGEDNTTPIALSPVLSRGTSPSRSRRRTITAQGSRNVHFQTSKGEERGGEGLKRMGSLRDFRLLQGDYETTEIGGDSSGSEQSDKSGKVGEIATDTRQQGHGPARTGGGGFFARWRQSSTHKSSPFATGEANDDLVELEPMASPHLQVTDVDEPTTSSLDSKAGSRNLLSRRSRKFGALPGHVSPYNSSNPFYGYPAYPILDDYEEAAPHQSSLQGPYQFGQEQRRLQFRRRKRDLLRTLMYLFVLRLLSTHRRVRNQILTVYKGLVRAARVGGVAEDEEETEEWKEANNRYNRLRSASLRYNDLYGRVPLGENSAHQQHAQKPQPLVQLGFRKRYAFLLLFLLIMSKKDWRSRFGLRLRDALGYAGLGKAGLDSVSEGEEAEIGDRVHDIDLNVGEPAAASVTGLYLRRRLLGWQ